MGGNSPCASCKSLRRRCAKDCIFAPYFPPDDPHKFAMVHKVFGASNVGKMLQELPVYQRADAVSSLVYEANARMRDPVYGCVGAISCLQNQVYQLQMELAVAQAQILCIQMEQEQEQQQQQENNVITLQPVDVHQHHQMVEIIGADHDQEKSIFMSSSSSTSSSTAAAATYNLNSLEAQQYLLNNYNFGPSSSCSVIHDPLKRESLWT